MPPAKVDLRSQARELAEDLDIPRVPLISRPAAPAAPPATHEPESVQEEAQITESAPEVPAPIPVQIRSRAPKVEAKVESVFNVLDSLAEEREELVPLNVRVASWVSAKLDEQILQMKLKRLRIKKEKVVEEAIIQYLGLKRPGA